MLDLVRIVHEFEADKVLRRPRWLEMNPQDVINPGFNQCHTANAMTHSVLADHFRLVIHRVFDTVRESRPFTTTSWYRRCPRPLVGAGAVVLLRVAPAGASTRRFSFCLDWDGFRENRNPSFLLWCAGLVDSSA
jgi:hypothetical protein